MVAQERARRIVAAWVAGSADGLKLELEQAFSGLHSNGTRSSLENEEQELLESIASDLYRTLGPRTGSGANRLESNLSLLKLVSHRAAPQTLNPSCAA
jgi:hypothetical protein